MNSSASKRGSADSGTLVIAVAVSLLLHLLLLPVVANSFVSSVQDPHLVVEVKEQSDLAIASIEAPVISEKEQPIRISAIIENRGQVAVEHDGRKPG